jgi:putative addiction module component (TIGR02574 family)
MPTYKEIFSKALKLRPFERAQLAEGLLESLDEPDQKINSIWEQEALKRYEKYKRGKVRAKDIEKVLKRYR